MRTLKSALSVFAVLATLSVNVSAEGRVLVSMRGNKTSFISDEGVKALSFPIRVSRSVLNARQFIVNTPDGPIVAQRNERTPKLSHVKTGGRFQTVATTTGRTVFSTKTHTSEYVLTIDDETKHHKVVHAIFSAHDDSAYVVRRFRGRMRLEIVKKSDLPSCGGIFKHGPERRAKGEALERSAAGDVRAFDTSVVDVAVFYSSEAYAAAGGTVASMIAEANSAVALGNQGYAQSGVGITLNLVHVSQTGSENGAGFGTILDNLINPSDGKYDDIPQTRLTVQADIGVYMINNQEYCGLAPLLIDGTDKSFALQAFATVNRACIPNHSFVHELSHIMGAHHDIANAGDTVIFPYAYGYRFRGISGAQYRTVMAYAPGARINAFSNPNLLFDGKPIGTSLANNARVLNNTGRFVANYSVFINPTPPTSPTAIPTETPTPVPGEPTPLPTETSIPGASGGPTGVSPPGAGYVFAQIQANIKRKNCVIHAAVIGSADAADGAIAQLLISKKNKVLASKVVEAGAVSFKIAKAKVAGKKLQLFLTSNVVSKSFKCR